MKKIFICLTSLAILTACYDGDDNDNGNYIRPTTSGDIVSDHGITDEMVFAAYSESEMIMIDAQPALKSAISGAYSYTPEETENIHKTMDEVFNQATTPQTYTSDASDTVNGDNTTGVTYTGYIYEGITGFSSLPNNVQRVIRIMPEAEFEYLFPVRHESYTYEDLLKAIAKWPKFCSEYNTNLSFNTSISSDILKQLDTVCGAELASMFAHFAQEVGAHYSGDIMATATDGYVSGGNIVLANPGGYFPTEEWRQALFHVEEAGYAGTDNIGYRGCDYATFQALAFPCGNVNASYHGRGAKQLSYNYNYAPFSRLMYGDMRLLETPELVSEDGFLALSSAVYFYMMPRSPKPSIHETVIGSWFPTEKDISDGRVFGFGIQTLIINGGIECGGSEEVAQSANRLSYFEGFARQFGAWDGWYENGKQGCQGTKVFDEDSTSQYFYKGYYTEDWNNIGSCFLVTWEETGFSAFFPGDAERCADSQDKKSFPDEIINGETVYYYENAYFEYNSEKTLSEVILHDSESAYFVNKLVQDDSSNIYRARRSVPENIALTDTYYWEATGAIANGIYIPEENTGSGGGSTVTPSDGSAGALTFEEVTLGEHLYDPTRFYDKTYTYVNGIVYKAEWYINPGDEYHPEVATQGWTAVGTIDMVTGELTAY